MDLKTVKQLAELMKQFGLSEVEFDQEGGKVRLCRNGGSISLPGHAAPAPVCQPAAAPAAFPQEEAVETINSPLVGTFYRSSSPDTAPFVSEGTEVTAGMVVCVVEAMKVMNEIKAEKSGVIRRILVKDASPVEFNQPMFEIQPKA